MCIHLLAADASVLEACSPPLLPRRLAGVANALQPQRCADAQLGGAALAFATCARAREFKKWKLGSLVQPLETNAVQSSARQTL